MHVRHSVLFDIDGTLINSRDLNVQAYRRVGVEMPDHAWSLRWQTWLFDLVGSRERAEQIHTAKVNTYVTMLRTVEISKYVLEPTYLARELLRRPDIKVRFLTAGTVTTANIILQRLGLGAPSMAGNLSYEARRLALHSSVLGSSGDVVYIDDHEENVLRLHDDVPGLTLIHYRGQTSAQLRETLQGFLNVKS